MIFPNLPSREEMEAKEINDNLIIIFLTISYAPDKKETFLLI